MVFQSINSFVEGGGLIAVHLVIWDRRLWVDNRNLWKECGDSVFNVK